MENTDPTPQPQAQTQTQEAMYLTIMKEEPIVVLRACLMIMCLVCLICLVILDGDRRLWTFMMLQLWLVQPIRL